MAYLGFCPPGVVFPYAGATAPDGWLLCDGSAISRTTYAALFAAISTAHGTGDGSTTFNIPDYRGRFLRGRDGGIARDPDRATRTASGTGGNTGDNVGSIENNATSASGLGGTAAGQTQGTSNISLASGSAAGQTQATSNVSLSASSQGTSSNGNTDSNNHAYARLSSNLFYGPLPTSGTGAGVQEAGFHSHSLTPSGTTNIGHTHGASSVSGTTNIAHTHSASALTVTSTATETRPININVNYIIKI